eukprot:Nk52_evm6s1705 gene=Nk52_evmTU6s1705
MVFKVPERVGRLGTETAYAVSLEAGELKAQGKTVYPFHIGDLNFKTPQCVIQAAKDSLDSGKTGYCPAAGIPELRAQMAARVGEDRGVEYGVENVSIQPGGKPVIGKFLLSVMEEGDEVLYPSPGYPIYESLINYYGGVPVPYAYKETENGFVLDMDQLKSSISQKTKAFIYNNPSNPVGAISDDDEMKELANICIENDLMVLSDEPYFDIVYEPVGLRSIVSIPGMKERTVILYTFSKNYAMTGWRLGAAIGPEEIIKLITKLNTNMEACTTHFLQWAAVECLKNREATDAYLKDMLCELKERRDCLVPLVNEIPGFVAHMPKSTFYLFVNVTEAMKMVGMQNVEDFRKTILSETGVSFCTREHFGKAQSYDTESYVRFAYSGVDCSVIKKACAALKEFMSGTVARSSSRRQSVIPALVDRTEHAEALIADTILETNQSLCETPVGKIAVVSENSESLLGLHRVRGALYAGLQLSEIGRSKGVVAVSSGDHGYAVAIASKRLGVESTVIVPQGTSSDVINLIKEQGAEVCVNDSTSYEDCMSAAMQLNARTGKTVVHAFDDMNILAGNGTVGREILNRAPGIKCIVLPLQNKALSLGIAAAIKASNKGIKTVGVNADALFSDPFDATAQSDFYADLLEDVIDCQMTVEEKELDMAEAAVKESGISCDRSAVVALAAVCGGKIDTATANVVAVLDGLSGANYVQSS